MKTTVIVPPEGEPVSLPAVKEFLRIGHAGEDALVGGLIESARARLEAELSVALVTQTVKMTLDAWPVVLAKHGLRLEPAPAGLLLEVASVSSDGAREIITSRFVLSGGKLRVRPSSFVPAIEAGGHVELVFETGFGAVDSLPDDLVLAVKMLVAQGYFAREGGRDSDENILPAEIDDLLAPYRGVRI